VTAAVKRLEELAGEREGGMRMGYRRPRRGVEIAVEHLGDEVLGHVVEIGVRCAFFQRLRGHCARGERRVIARV